IQRICGCYDGAGYDRNRPGGRDAWGDLVRQEKARLRYLRPDLGWHRLSGDFSRCDAVRLPDRIPSERHEAAHRAFHRGSHRVWVDSDEKTHEREISFIYHFWWGCGP